MNCGLILCLVVVVAVGVADARRKKRVTNLAASNSVNCGCQCISRTFQDRRGRVHGNCRRSYNGGEWCYVEGWNSPCSDLRRSKRFNNPWSYEACSTRLQNQCNPFGGGDYREYRDYGAPCGSPGSGCAIGRPFVVHGESRTTSSKTFGSNQNDSESWKTGSVPSISPESPDQHEIGLYWLQQAEAEHASVASFARHTLQLMSLGAPAHLLAASQQASLDEINHARICYGFASAFLGQEFGPGLLDVDESLENMDLKEIIRSVITEGCIGETLSAVEAHLAAHYAQDPAVKDALEQIASEETNHGQLAWDTIKWIIDKHPESRSYVDGVFQDELEQRRMPARNGTALPLTSLCQDSEKKTSLRRYGLIDGDDRVRVGEAGIRNIIEPVYKDGFNNVNIISKWIKQFDVSAI